MQSSAFVIIVGLSVLINFCPLYVRMYVHTYVRSIVVVRLCQRYYDLGDISLSLSTSLSSFPWLMSLSDIHWIEHSWREAR